MSATGQGGSPALGPAGLAAALRRLDTCAIANAIECTGVRLRNEGFADATIACLVAASRPLVGYAFTLRLRTSDPPIEGLDFADRVDWWDRLLEIPEPRVLVVEDTDTGPATGAFLGEVHANVFRALGCAGVVTNGAVRDLPGLEALGFPAFASHVAVSHAYAHVVEVGEPVTVGGLRVTAGDLLHGDQHGVLGVPLSVAPQLPHIADRLHRRERAIIELCRSPHFSVDALKALLGRLSH
jgi:4-hydroxy-4-methyl-2-oxoglutarate aldolase